MKKIMLAAAIAALSSTAFAGGSVGLGYQASTVAPNYGDCWSECFGDGEPEGFALNASYNLGSNVFVGLDYADLADEEDHYDDKIAVGQIRLAAQVGYKYALNADTTLTAAVELASYEWDYSWVDSGSNNYFYDAEDDGYNLIVGASTKINDKLSLGGSLTGGFETGVNAYMAVALTPSVSVKTSYSRVSYELAEWAYRPFWNGYEPNSGSALGDGDMQFNDENFRVSLNYAF